MSSLTDKEFDDKLDQLLKESVSPGAAPADLFIAVLPRRPRFNWVLWGFAFAGVIGIGMLLFWMIIAQSTQADAVSGTAGQNIWSLLSDGIVIGAERLSSPTILWYTALIMGSVYIYFGRRIMRLYRLY